VKFFRQVALALVVAASVATALRVKGKPVQGPRHGGWREVTPQR
jgi:hypothetical protein